MAEAAGQLAGLLMIAVLPAVAGLSGLGFDDPDFANGYRLATQVCAGLCIVAAAVAVFTIPSSPARAEAEERANEGSDGLPPIRVTIDSGPSVDPLPTLNLTHRSPRRVGIANMNLQLTSQQIWDEVEKNTFAVLGMVTAKGEPRTVGIVYVVDDHKLYIGAERTQWKTKHIERNPHVSATVPIPKRVPLMPWIKVPAATITFSGTAQILEKQDLGAELLDKLYRHDEDRGEWCAIKMTPQKDFITYGVGVSLLTMRSPDKSRSRAPVGLDEVHDARTDTTTADPGRRTDANETLP